LSFVETLVLDATCLSFVETSVLDTTFLSVMEMIVVDMASTVFIIFTDAIILRCTTIHWYVWAVSDGIRIRL